MRLPGRTVRLLALIFVLMALLPLGASLVVARKLVDHMVSLVSNQNIDGEVERSLNVYNELAQAIKAGMRAKADAIAAQEPLRAAALLRDGPSIDQELEAVFKMYPDLVSITISAPPLREPDKEDEEGDDGAEREPVRIGYRDRGQPVNDATERKLEVVRPLDKRDGAPTMTAVFATSRGKFDQQQHASEFLQVYRPVIRRERRNIERALVLASGALVAFTSLAALGIGAFLGRYVTRRIDALAGATRRVGAGDLSVRVPVEGKDELTELAQAFNRMLEELNESRARVEFLRQMGTWQEMARRLAHEIKNPLTPIQLAVQECHRRYDGSSKPFRKLLDTTLEIVEEEVGTLRRLVTEFSNFARLPRADLAAGDLVAYLREQQEKLAVTEGDEVAGHLDDVAVAWNLPERPLRVAFDSFLLHRVLVNLVANAAQAIRGASPDKEASVGAGQVRVSAAEEPGVAVLDVDDSGPGVPEALRERIFDPYFTTKSDGNGLGLAIVKKVIVEHGGTIEASSSPLGGARIRVRLPLVGTAASQVALAHSGGQSLPLNQHPD